MGKGNSFTGDLERYGEWVGPPQGMEKESPGAGHTDGDQEETWGSDISTSLPHAHVITEQEESLLDELASREDHDGHVSVDEDVGDPVPLIGLLESRLALMEEEVGFLRERMRELKKLSLSHNAPGAPSLLSTKIELAGDTDLSPDEQRWPLSSPPESELPVTEDSFASVKPHSPQPQPSEKTVSLSSEDLALAEDEMLTERPESLSEIAEHPAIDLEEDSRRLPDEEVDADFSEPDLKSSELSPVGEDDFPSEDLSLVEEEPQETLTRVDDLSEVALESDPQRLSDEEVDADFSEPALKSSELSPMGEDDFPSEDLSLVEEEPQETLTRVDDLSEIALESDPQRLSDEEVDADFSEPDLKSSELSPVGEDDFPSEDLSLAEEEEPQETLTQADDLSEIALESDPQRLSDEEVDADFSEPDLKSSELTPVGEENFPSEDLSLVEEEPQDTLTQADDLSEIALESDPQRLSDEEVDEDFSEPALKRSELSPVGEEDFPSEDLSLVEEEPQETLTQADDLSEVGLESDPQRSSDEEVDADFSEPVLKSSELSPMGEGDFSSEDLSLAEEEPQETLARVDDLSEPTLKSSELPPMGEGDFSSEDLALVEEELQEPLTRVDDLSEVTLESDPQRLSGEEVDADFSETALKSSELSPVGEDDFSSEDLSLAEEEPQEPLTRVDDFSEIALESDPQRLSDEEVDADFSEPALKSSELSSVGEDDFSSKEDLSLPEDEVSVEGTAAVPPELLLRPEDLAKIFPDDALEPLSEGPFTAEDHLQEEGPLKESELKESAASEHFLNGDHSDVNSSQDSPLPQGGEAPKTTTAKRQPATPPRGTPSKGEGEKANQDLDELDSVSLSDFIPPAKLEATSAEMGMEATHDSGLESLDFEEIHKLKPSQNLIYDEGEIFDPTLASGGQQGENWPDAGEWEQDSEEDISELSLEELSPQSEKLMPVDLESSDEIVFESGSGEDFFLDEPADDITPPQPMDSDESAKVEARVVPLPGYPKFLEGSDPEIKAILKRLDRLWVSASSSEAKETLGEHLENYKQVRRELGLPPRD